MMQLQEIELFQQVPPYITSEIAQFATEESFPAERVLFNEGDPADYVYILEDGQVAITITGRATVTIPIDEAGSLFGWSALVAPRKYTAAAQFTMDSKVIKIDGKRMLKVLEEHPHAGYRIMQRLASVIASRLVKSYQGVTAPRR